jgi:predicted permease
MSRAPHPPRLAETLLHWLLDDESREAVIGDLHEGYLAFRTRHHAAAAGRWYWIQAIRSIVSCRVTGQRSSESRRLDFDETGGMSLRDLMRPAMRQFRDHPLYALACAGTLALAVGAACVSLAVVKRAFIEPLPYRDGHEIVSLLTFADGLASAVSPHVLEDLRASRSPFVEFAPIRPTGVAYSSDSATETVSVSFVDLEYFKLLGVVPAVGRLWTNQESDAVVISAAFWRDRLAQDGRVIGKAVVLDGRPRVVVGVMPSDFTPPYFVTTDIWAPVDMAGLLADIRTRRTLTILARRAPHATPADVDAYLAVFSRQMQERFPAMHGGQAWIARPLRDELVGSARPALIGTAAGAVLLLLIVGANVAGLSTAHAVSARHQLAVRAALGATRGRLFVEQLIDSTILALVGSIAGLWIAYGLLAVVGRYQDFFLPRLGLIALDWTTIAGGLTAGLVVGIAAALLPQSVVNAAPGEALRTSRGGTADVKVTATRTVLVVAQVAIALVLLVGAALLVRTVRHLADRDLGFDSAGLTWLQVNLPGARYQSPDAQLQFERDVLERIQHIAGVESAIASVGFPLWGGMMAGLADKGDAPGTPRREVAYLSVSPNFVADIGARIVAGRDLLPTDDASAPRVVVINETMARMFWPQGDALGAEVQIGPGSPNERWITVVGIMADMRAHGVTEAIRPTAFGSTRQYSWPRRHIAVRTSGFRSPTLATDLKSAIQGIDPSVAIGVVTSAEQTLMNSTARHRLVMLALAVFGGVALVLCVSGLYAVVALSSEQRRREYAIRVALGARRGGVRWMVVRQALAIAGLGAAIGLLAAAVGTRAIQGLLHGVRPFDVPTFAAAALVLLTLAMLAAWHPARKAEHVDPLEALRSE